MIVKTPAMMSRTCPGILSNMMVMKRKGKHTYVGCKILITMIGGLPCAFLSINLLKFSFDDQWICARCFVNSSLYQKPFRDPSVWLVGPSFYLGEIRDESLQEETINLLYQNAGLDRQQCYIVHTNTLF